MTKSEECQPDFKVRAYVCGKAVPIEGVTNMGSTILEVELHDGRTVQMVVRLDGTIHIRGWGNVPAKVLNCNSVEVTCILPFQTP